jgi:hypothetical protein
VTEPQGCYGPLDEVEALVRVAGDYVHASEDLRPRVLEAARARRGQLRIWQVAVFIVLAGVFVTSVCYRPQAAARKTATTVDAGQIFSQPEARARYGDSAWEMVESFTQLRRHHAELLRLTL